MSRSLGLHGNRLLVAALVMAVTPNAFGTPYVEECRRPDEYAERTHQLIDEVRDSPFELLIVMYSHIGKPQEIAIGLVRESEGAHLVRLEFQPSLFYSSYRQISPREQVLDFANTKPRIDKLSVPISSQMAQALAGTLKSITAQATPREPDRVVLDDGEILDVVSSDGFTQDLTLSDGRCVEINDPLPESSAKQLIALNRYLARELLSWKSETRADFEAQVTMRLNAIDPKR